MRISGCPGGRPCPGADAPRTDPSGVTCPLGFSEGENLGALVLGLEQVGNSPWDQFPFASITKPTINSILWEGRYAFLFPEFVIRMHNLEKKMLSIPCPEEPQLELSALPEDSVTLEATLRPATLPPPVHKGCGTREGEWESLHCLLSSSQLEKLGDSWGTAPGDLGQLPAGHLIWPSEVCEVAGLLTSISPVRQGRGGERQSQDRRP